MISFNSSSYRYFKSEPSSKISKDKDAFDGLPESTRQLYTAKAYVDYICKPQCMGWWIAFAVALICLMMDIIMIILLINSRRKREAQPVSPGTRTSFNRHSRRR